MPTASALSAVAPSAASPTLVEPAVAGDTKMGGNDNDRDQSGKRSLEGDDPLADRTSDDAVAKAAVDELRKTPTSELGNVAKDTIKTVKQHNRS